MHDLAARCDAADGPDRELDFEIAVQVLGWKIWRSKHGHWNFDGPNGERVSSFEGPRQLRFDPDTGEANPHYDTPPLTWLADEAQLPAFTASIDTAMTLVPEGWALHMLYETRTAKGQEAVVWPPGVAMPTSAAKTLPLAICAASLRARADKGTQT